jgi:hypothetical protein
MKLSTSVMAVLLAVAMFALAVEHRVLRDRFNELEREVNRRTMQNGANIQDARRGLREEIRENTRAAMGLTVELARNVHERLLPLEAKAK